MVAEMQGLLIVLVGLAVALGYYLVCLRGRGAGDERGLPRALRGAEVAYAEQTFKSVRLGVVARLDRAYRVGRRLVLVELKTRAKDQVYMSDIIELSVQRVALQDQLGMPVDATAWVVVEQTGTRRRRAHQVTLLDDGAVEQLKQRYVSVAGGWSGRVKVAATPAQCRNCGHAPHCSASKAT